MADLIPRHVKSWADELLAHTPAVIIEGARQVGKSTLAGELARRFDGAVVVSLDDERTRDLAVEDSPGFVAQAGNGLLVIDEIQRLPPLTLAIKASIDADRRPGRFLLTGSSSLLRARGLADSLAGRIARVNLYGLSQGEIGRRWEDFGRAALSLGQSADHESLLTRDDYVELVAAGCFPEFRALPERLRGQRLDDYVRSMVERDLTELRKEVQPARSLALLRALAGNQAGELVKSRLADTTSIPTGTITGYLDLLHDVGLVASLPPWTPNLAKREVGRPKTIVVDSGLATRLCRLSAGQLRRFEYGEALGALLEAFVAAELLKQRTWSEEEFELFHYRDRDGLEVDLVIEFYDGRVLAIEVKASTSFRGAQFAGLKTLRDLLGDRFVAGIVLNTGQSGYRFSDRLFGLPISSLWELAPTAKSVAVE